jgi:hypothetical protein
MKRTQFSKLSAIIAPLVIGFSLLGSAPLARAQSDDGKCSNRTLRGDYGFVIEALLLAGPSGPVSGALRGIAMTHFDGNGNLTQVDHVLINGVAPPVEWRPATGTYKVNPDCTGTAEITNSGRPPMSLHFVVVRNGREIHTVVEGPGPASSVGIKVDGSM